MTRRMWLIGVMAVVAAGVLAVAWLYDPMGGEFPYPRCLFKSLTGWDCPGCGSARALHALTHGRVGDAWRANPAVFVAVPLAALAFVAEGRRGAGLRRVLFSIPAAALLLSATIIWTIFRNA